MERSLMNAGRKHPVHQPLFERGNEPVLVFLTVCTHQRKRILACEEVVSMLRETWQAATSWQVGRFVVMPDHVHLFCAPGEWPARALGRWVRYWKTLASRQWPRPGEQPVWQRDFWETQLRRSEGYEEKWEYVRRNPVRAGLAAKPEDWKHQGELNALRW